MSIPTLSPMQEGAVKAVGNWYADCRSSNDGTPLFDLRGYAGTGKSTILPSIIDKLGIHPENVAFTAPTGKAAKVMGEKLRAFGITQRPRTNHSLIYRPKPIRAEVLQKSLDDAKAQRDYILQNGSSDPGKTQEERLQEMDTTIHILERDLEKAYDRHEGPSFYLNPDSEVRNMKLIICDEASMVGETVGEDLKSFNVPILAIGDDGQLPPVGEANGLFKDKPDFLLSEIHRQARDNPIIRLATMAREGKELKIADYGDGVRVIPRLRDDVTYNPDVDAQIICGTHKKRWQITSKLRRTLGYLSTGPCRGEPLIVCKNSKAIPDLVNGTFVSCAEAAGDLEEGESVLAIRIEDEQGNQRSVLAVQGLFEEHVLKVKNGATGRKSDVFRARITSEHLDYGWAITCHKSQGSQWDEIVLHDESGTFRDASEKWLYTGITRAAQRLTVVV